MIFIRAGCASPVQHVDRLCHESVEGRIETGRWYGIKIQLDGNRIRCWLDDELIHDVQAEPEKTLFASAGCDDSTGDLILKVINTDAAFCRDRINITAPARFQSMTLSPCCPLLWKAWNFSTSFLRIH